MPSSIFQGWAPPGIWGPWIDLGPGKLYGGIFTWELTFTSESSATATFDIEVNYFIGNTEKTDRLIGPGTHIFGFGMCACKARVRMKSHLLGQNVRIVARHP